MTKNRALVKNINYKMDWENRYTLILKINVDMIDGSSSHKTQKISLSDDGIVHLHMLFSPNPIKSGFGSWMLKQMLSEVIHKFPNSTIIKLFTHKDAHHFFEKIGFEYRYDPYDSTGLYDIEMFADIKKIIDNYNL